MDNPKLYPAEHVHPVSGIEFRRKNVGNFSIIYAFFEPTPALPKGEVSIRAVRHGAEEDLLFGVEESRANPGGLIVRLETGYRSAYFSLVEEGTPFPRLATSAGSPARAAQISAIF